MRKLIDRYILKEVFSPFLIGLLVYTFVMLMNQILLLSEIFIVRDVPFKSVMSLLFYLIPSLLAFTVPMSVLVGILAGLSRMSSDSEITALKTLGVNYTRILRPLLFFSLGGMLLTAFLTLYFAPWANYKWTQLFKDTVLTRVQLQITPRQFNESLPNTVIYIQDITKTNEWENVFVQMTGDPEEPKVIYAERGGLSFFPEDKLAVLKLYNGAVHYPISDSEGYRITTFEYNEEEIDVENLFHTFSNEKGKREKNIKELFQVVNEMEEEIQKIPETQENSIRIKQQRRDLNGHKVEIHKKFALPFSCLIFALLGLSLGATTKKGGRTSGFTISIVIILIYYILITAGEQLSIDSDFPTWLGMWGPNILLFICGLYFFIRSLRESASFFSHISLFGRKQHRGKSGYREAVESRRSFRLSLPFPNILDRYIIRKFLFIFLMLFISLLAIYVIITFFERINEIYEHNKPLSLFFTYIWFKIPEFVHIILPVTALTSTLLCLGLLNKFNEITAMKTCGISLYRIVLPLVFLALLTGILSFYLQEKILPNSNKRAEETWNQIQDLPARTVSQSDRRWVMGKDRNRIYYYLYFDQWASVFSQLSIYDFDSENWFLRSRVYAKKARLESSRLYLNDAWKRDFKNDKLIDFEKRSEMTIRIDEDKSYFLREWKAPDQMNYPELKKYIEEIETRGFETVRYKVDLHFKLSFPFISLIMVFLGIPFAFTMGKRGALVGLGVSMIIAMVYWGAIGIFRGLGYVGYMSPELAAWGPNVVFGLVGIYLILNLRT